jgi:hypothetical protein
MRDKPTSFPRITPILERERRAGRLGIAEYGAACIYRSILQQIEPGSLVSLPGEEAVSRFPHADIIGAMTDCALADEHRKMVAREIGSIAESFLHAVLIDGHSFSKIARTREYGMTKQSIERAGNEFRLACHDLALLYGSQKAEKLKSRQDESHA